MVAAGHVKRASARPDNINLLNLRGTLPIKCLEALLPDGRKFRCFARSSRPNIFLLSMSLSPCLTISCLHACLPACLRSLFLPSPCISVSLSYCLTSPCLSPISLPVSCISVSQYPCLSPVSFSPVSLYPCNSVSVCLPI